jgi:VWFA-related protein
VILLAAALAVTLAEADAGSVRIGTTVTDRQGRPVSGLTAKDFELRVDGVVQKIDAVEARKPEKRRLAILLDEFHVEPGDTARVRAALLQFVDGRLRDGDLALVLKPMDPLTAIRLTSDRDELRRLISGFEGRKGLYEPRTPLEADTLGTAPALVETGRAQVVLSALRALTGQLGSVAGRSAILFVSEGFATQSRHSTSRGLPDASIVERFANRYDVPIYAIDPRSAAPDDDVGVTMLAKLVSETGGTLAHGHDLAASVERAAAELDGGYTVLYTSPRGNDGRYHPLQVTVSRREADARTRAGYISLPSDATRRELMALLDDKPRTPPRPLRHSPLVNIWSGVTRMDAGEARIAVAWEPASHATAATPARVALKATTPEGKLLFEGILSAARSGDDGRSAHADFPSPPGRVQLDMTVLGVTGQRLDTDIRDLEVPAQKDATPLLLPPVMISVQSAREFRDMAGNADAPPVPTREFRRTERVLIRVPAYSAGAPLPVTARLLNRVGQAMRDLTVLPGDPAVTQFDLPLAALAPGDYFLQFTVQGPSGPVSQRVAFKITG